jgi:formate dehydrogenase gamma subunit
MASEATQEYERFTPLQRLEHWLMAISFTGLAITGFPQLYALQGWAQNWIGVMGGIEFTRIMHRIFATALMTGTILHLITMFYRMYVLRRRASMLPRVKDLTDMVGAVAHNLGLRKNRPAMPRYNYEEKMEYWAFVWGAFVMIITGFMLWNPIATASFLPGEFIPAAKQAHGAEAFLAIMAIILWHFYSVHIRHFNKSMFTGKLDRHTMEEEHAEELAAIEAGKVWHPPSAETYRKRMRLFVPIALVLFALLVAGLVWFVSFEQTAITTIPSF